TDAHGEVFRRPERRTLGRAEEARRFGSYRRARLVLLDCGRGDRAGASGPSSIGLPAGGKNADKRTASVATSLDSVARGLDSNHVASSPIGTTDTPRILRAGPNLSAFSPVKHMTGSTTRADTVSTCSAIRRTLSTSGFIGTLTR